jgi:hypothetical protein
LQKFSVPPYIGPNVSRIGNGSPLERAEMRFKNPDRVRKKISYIISNYKGTLIQLCDILIKIFSAITDEEYNIIMAQPIKIMDRKGRIEHIQKLLAQEFDKELNINQKRKQ